jgi:hypothetical protein
MDFRQHGRRLSASQRTDTPLGPQRTNAPRLLICSPAGFAPQRREAFVAAVERHRQAILAERKAPFNPENKNHQHQVQRQAVRRAFLKLGLLTTTRRSITPPIK